MTYANAERNKDTTIDTTKIKAITAAKVFLVLGLLKFIIRLTSKFIVFFILTLFLAI